MLQEADVAPEEQGVDSDPIDERRSLVLRFFDHRHEDVLLLDRRSSSFAAQG